MIVKDIDILLVKVQVSISYHVYILRQYHNACY